jgi:hypothetical protein
MPLGQLNGVGVAAASGGAVGTAVGVQLGVGRQSGGQTMGVGVAVVLLGTAVAITSNG